MISDQRKAIGQLKAHAGVVREWYMEMLDRMEWHRARDVFEDVDPADHDAVCWVNMADLKEAARGYQFSANASAFLEKAQLFVESDATDEEDMVYTYFANTGCLFIGAILVMTDQGDVVLQVWDRGELRSIVNDMLGYHDSIVLYLESRRKELEFK